MSAGEGWHLSGIRYHADNAWAQIALPPEDLRGYQGRPQFGITIEDTTAGRVDWAGGGMVCRLLPLVVLMGAGYCQRVCQGSINVGMLMHVNDRKHRLTLLDVIV